MFQDESWKRIVLKQELLENYENNIERCFQQFAPQQYYNIINTQEWSIWNHKVYKLDGFMCLLYHNTFYK